MEYYLCGHVTDVVQFSFLSCEGTYGIIYYIMMIKYSQMIIILKENLISHNFQFGSIGKWAQYQMLLNYINFVSAFQDTVLVF